MVIILSVIVLMIVVFFAYQQFFSRSGVRDNINFSKTGNLVMNNPGMDRDVWYLVYDIPGSPAGTAKLYFNEESVCENQKYSCLDLIIGERVSVRGIENDGEVSVREMQFLDEPDVFSPSGIDWDTALDFLNNCEVSEVSVSNGREVYLALKDGREMFAVGPESESVLSEIKMAEKVCGQNLVVDD